MITSSFYAFFLFLKGETMTDLSDNAGSGDTRGDAEFEMFGGLRPEGDPGREADAPTTGFRDASSLAERARAPDIQPWRALIEALNAKAPGSGFVFDIPWEDGFGALGVCLQAVQYRLSLAERLRTAARFLHVRAGVPPKGADPEDAVLLLLMTESFDGSVCPCCGARNQRLVPGWARCGRCRGRFEVVPFGNGVASRDRYEIRGDWVYDRARQKEVAGGTGDLVATHLYHLMNRGEPLPTGMNDGFSYLVCLDMGFDQPGSDYFSAETADEVQRAERGLFKTGPDPLAQRPLTPHGKQIRKNLKVGRKRR